MTRALVLGGGGVTGIAWETGVLLGLRDEGVDLVDVDLTVGTSAGSAVGAQVCSGVDLEELYARQVAEEHHEIAAELDLDLLIKIFGELPQGGVPDAALLARIGTLALSATTVPEATRRAVIEHRLPVHTWPEARLVITAVDVASGAFAAFDSSSGVELVDAVAASCAVPGVWPPVTIGGTRYMDGGVRSVTNTDLAAGCDQIVVLAPLAGPSVAMARAEVERARASAVVELLVADEAAAEAMGVNALDPAMRRPAAEAGRRQGRAAAAGLAAALA